MWLDNCESGALDQASNLANLPFAFKHIALMPDCHQGYGMPIGGVMATKGVIVPNAVGVDIGCGIIASKLSLTELDTDDLKKIMGIIRKTIPVGRDKHDKPQDRNLMPNAFALQDVLRNSMLEKHWENSLRQLGTLGGGNHFIEIQKGDDGNIWVMIHSGSRGLGKKIADKYNDIAKELNAKWHSEVPPSWDLAFLQADSKEGKEYIAEMEYGVEYARESRKLMMSRALKAFHEILGQTAFSVEQIVHIPHNYASLENHFGQNVWIHRKGATLARKDTIGLIPGSQGTNSYVVQGKGNPESFETCSHGAGRVLSRSKARDTLDIEAERKILDDLGVVHAIRNEKDLDEAPSAYKDIHEVMENQKDLVDILVELTPLGVVKG